MTSLIDPTKPIAGNPTTASVRDNFNTAKTEITSLQLSRILRIANVAPTIEIFQQIASNDTLQVIQFNSTTFRNPDDNTVYEFDGVNNEIIFHETGWYEASVSLHVDRKVASGADATFHIWSQLKTPGGSFSNFPDSLRSRTLPSTSAVSRNFSTIAFISKIMVADSRLRWVQATNDATKQIGVVSYPPVGIYPGAPGIIFSVQKLGDL